MSGLFVAMSNIFGILQQNWQVYSSVRPDKITAHT
jgi:hypothetical protein